MKLSEIKKLIKEEVQKSNNTVYVDSSDNFKVKHGGKLWTVEYHNHEEGDPITLTSGKEKVTGKVTKVTPNGNLTIKLNESKFGVVIDGKQVDIGSIELEDVFAWDRPDFADAYASAAQFEDGTELTDIQLEKLTDEHSDIINMIANGIN